ncbi:ImmA/IrrE family metallo-endopeptidase [Fusobacterium necrophorum]|uniref:ImmA/IrrE family metallo-endopeptidase n=1 Tax=Fusobacterium necrophorum TaxID=859 RepID=UPI0030D0AAB7
MLNSELQGFSKYFTLAHELWHAIEDNGDDVRFFKDYTFANIDIYETKANTFAAYLLLDEDTDQFNIENLDLLDDDVKKELERFIQRTLDRNQIIF